MPLLLEPVLETLEVDQSDRATALAGQDQGVRIRILFRTPAETALDRLLSSSKVASSLDCLGLLELLDKEFLGRKVHLLAAEVLDAETHPAELDGVELLDFVVELAFRVLQRPYHEPEPVYGLFFRV